VRACPPEHLRVAEPWTRSRSATPRASCPASTTASTARRSCTPTAPGRGPARPLRIAEIFLVVAGCALLVFGPSWRAPGGSLRRSGTDGVELFSGGPRPTCLCLFDVDRTLTAKQGQAQSCPGTAEVPGVEDTAFGGGTLVLSDLALNLGKTFCGACYRGIVTVGPVSGAYSKQREELLQALGGPQWTFSDKWSWAAEVSSLLVTGASDEHKHETVRKIVDWLRAQGPQIQDSEVYFFDDNSLNPPPFAGSGFNAHQVSCQSREGIIGHCGALATEVVGDHGVKSC